MKEILLAIGLILLLNVKRAATGSDRRYNALKFGQSHTDYILYQPDMRSFERALTVCAWIRKLDSQNTPNWFNYAVSGYNKEIQITDNGYQFFMFGDESDLRSYYTVSPGTWYHNCLSWDSASRSRSVYINGILINSEATPSGRTLGQGGHLLLGNEQDGPGSSMDNGNRFGGEMYKLNVYSKKLSQSEIRKMASDRCSGAEELAKESSTSGVF